MNCSDNFYDDSKYTDAHKFASKYINRMLSKYSDFEWGRWEPETASFDDMNFRYKNSVFSVLMKIYYNGDLLPSYTERELDWVDIAEKNDLIPIVFPVEITKHGNTYKCRSLMKGLDFWDWMTTDTMNVFDLSSDKPQKMSHYELLSAAITETVYLLHKRGYKIIDYGDNPSLPDYWPRIWIEDKSGKLSWVVVRYGNNENIKKPNIHKMSLFPAYNDGYFAPIIFEYEGKKPYRGSKLKVRYLKNVITKVYDANKCHKTKSSKRKDSDI